MNKSIIVELNEEDVELAIKEYIRINYQVEVKSIRMQTGVIGNYDNGTAEEYVKTVQCDCE
ncbi:MAG: hypothetical protein PF436_09070 [Prolixibacteraceae bacterium]|jgi:hypothetical protein|nr:hypothetical protein [Prolixibacteraceae bacterium]